MCRPALAWRQGSFVCPVVRKELSVPIRRDPSDTGWGACFPQAAAPPPPPPRAGGHTPHTHPHTHTRAVSTHRLCSRPQVAGGPVRAGGPLSSPSGRSPGRGSAPGDPGAASERERARAPAAVCCLRDPPAGWRRCPRVPGAPAPRALPPLRAPPCSAGRSPSLSCGPCVRTGRSRCPCARGRARATCRAAGTEALPRRCHAGASPRAPVMTRGRLL